MTKPISELWYEAASVWTDLESAADLLESTKSSVLSQMMATHGDIPVSKAESFVKRSKEWIEHVTKVCAARTAANKAKIRMDYYRMRASEEMSKEATARLEAKI
jgi:hypothetical protein